jgi:lipopolysaccharide/colanic/teichoic acid biosynthesis glycosyltransferase
MTLQSSGFTPDLTATDLSRARIAGGAVAAVAIADAGHAPRSTPRSLPAVYRLGVKRALDILLVLIAAPVVLPVVLVLALLVMRDGGRPFYGQARLGLGGRSFRMWKLRSMVEGADALLEAHLAADPAARAEWDATQKLKVDPRVTRIGRFLRRSSLDELPQLWNVLVGDMSLVGPRPMMVCQRALYPGQSYFRLRPGITGPWQVSDRHESDFVDRVRFDDAYDRSLSLGTDLRLLWRTVWVVLRGTGC